MLTLNSEGEERQEVDKNVTEVEEQQQTEQENNENQNQAAETETEEPTDAHHETSTAPDIGVPVICNLCQVEISSKLIVSHCEAQHNVQNTNIRSLAKISQVHPDSIYSKLTDLQPGVTVADPVQGKYFVLQSRVGNVWKARDIASQNDQNLDLLHDLSGMRFVGIFQREEEEGVVVQDGDQQEIFYAKDAFTQRVFFTSENNYESEQTFIVTIPRSKHYCIPPPEANVPRGKLWAIKRSCYGLIDASRAFYIRYVKALRGLD